MCYSVLRLGQSCLDCMLGIVNVCSVFNTGRLTLHLLTKYGTNKQTILFTNCFLFLYYRSKCSQYMKCCYCVWEITDLGLYHLHSLVTSLHNDSINVYHTLYLNLVKDIVQNNIGTSSTNTSTRGERNKVTCIIFDWY